MWGMLLAIPFAAILDIVIKEGLMPLIRKRKQENSGNKLME